MQIAFAAALGSSAHLEIPQIVNHQPEEIDVRRKQQQL
jgi:hypothetical protein